MAMRVEQADRMVEAVEAAGVTCVPFSGLTRLRLRDVKARIDTGEIGDIIVMHQTSRWSIAEDGLSSGKPGWFVDPRYVPGGALIDEGIYWIELFEWFAGVRSCEVEARVANLVHKDLEVEDWGMATFTFANGVIGNARSVVDDQCAAKDWPVAEAQCRRAAGGGRFARRDHRSVVPLTRARRAGGRRRRLGIRAPAGRPFCCNIAPRARSPDRLPGSQPQAGGHDPAGASRIPRRDGGLRVGTEGKELLIAIADC